MAIPSSGQTIMDFEAGTMTVDMNTGTTATRPLPPRLLAEDLQLRYSAFDFCTRQMTLGLPEADVTVEIGWPGADDPPAGTPIVYLDQRDWITLTKQIYTPDKLTAHDRAAAATLIELARAGQVVLPMSAGHLVETGPSTGPRRARLVTTILDLSRGWQMRNPIEIRAREFRAGLAGRGTVVDSVFTLEPEILFSGSAPYAPAATDADELSRRQTWAASLYTAMFDQVDRELTEEARRKGDAWAAKFQELADKMRVDRTSRDDARTVARLALLKDHSVEIEAAAQVVQCGQEVFGFWVNRTAENGFAEMPYLARAEGLLYHRLRDANDKWERNDLVDMNFLCSAAGYADVVVGERKTIEYLRRIEDEVPNGAVVCPRLPEAVNSISALVQRSA